MEEQLLFISVIAQTDLDKGHKGINALIVEKDMQWVPNWPKRK